MSSEHSRVARQHRAILAATETPTTEGVVIAPGPAITTAPKATGSGGSDIGQGLLIGFVICLVVAMAYIKRRAIRTALRNDSRVRDE